MGANGERSLRLLVAVHDHTWHLLELRIADPLGDGLVTLIHIGADTGVLEPRPKALDRHAMILADGDQPHLHRSKPERECPAVVLDEDADEAFERTEQRAMDDDGRVFGVVGADISRSEERRVGKECRL